MNLIGYDNATAQSYQTVAHVTSYVGHNSERLVGVGPSFQYMRAHHDENILEEILTNQYR